MTPSLRPLRLAMQAGLVALGLALSGCAGGAGARAPDAHEEPEILSAPSARIGLRRSLAADQYFWLRSKLLEGEAPKPFVPSFEAMQALRADFGGDSTGWEALEFALGSATRPSQLEATYDQLPKLVHDSPTDVVMLRQGALRLSRAMTDSEKAYQEGPWREHSAAIAQAAQDLSQRLAASEAKILEAVVKDLGLSALEPPMITLVYDAPYPGSFAADESGRTSASFVRVRGLRGNELVEVMLREVLSAIDEHTVRDPGTAFNQIRQAFARQGLDESNMSVALAVDAVTVAEADSLIRRFVDPSYQSRAAADFYANYLAATPVVRAWEKHVAGESTQATAETIARAGASPTP